MTGAASAPPPAAAARMPAAVWALSVGAFAIGTSEFVIMGLLLEMARDLQVTISAAGFIVTAYALGVVVGAPLLTPWLSRFPQRGALVGLMLIFAVGNVACALAGSFPLILAARVVTSFAHASYFGIGSVVAAQVAPIERRSSAIAAMFLGATLANILGVPGGTLIGQLFGWRSTFAVVTVLGAAAALATALLVPARAGGGRPGALSGELAALRRPEILRAFAITAFGFGGTFTAFTYIAPMLTEVTGISDRWVSPLLLLFGAGMVVGNPIGGRLADRNIASALGLTLACLALCLFALSPALATPGSAAVAIFLLGIAMFATIAPLQTNVIHLAQEAPTLAASCNIAAFNLGNAGGAWLGGHLIASGVGLRLVPLAGGLVTLVGLALAMSAQRPRVARNAAL